MKTIFVPLASFVDTDAYRMREAFCAIGASRWDGHAEFEKYSKIINKYRKGSLSDGVFRSQLCAALNINPSDAEFDNAWNAMSIVNERSVEKFEQLLHFKEMGVDIRITGQSNHLHVHHIKSGLRANGIPLDSIEEAFSDAVFSYKVNLLGSEFFNECKKQAGDNSVTFVHSAKELQYYYPAVGSNLIKIQNNLHSRLSPYFKASSISYLMNLCFAPIHTQMTWQQYAAQDNLAKSLVQNGFSLMSWKQLGDYKMQLLTQFGMSDTSSGLGFKAVQNAKIMADALEQLLETVPETVSASERLIPGNVCNFSFPSLEKSPPLLTPAKLQHKEESANQAVLEQEAQEASRYPSRSTRNPAPNYKV